jgi:hypothetical protein
MIPPFPARPINGGPLDRARPKLYPDRWAYEPKVNGWRALVHTPTGSMFNRHREPMSIANEFFIALGALRSKAQETDVPEWLDCEAFSRRHALGKGSLILFDYIPKPTDKTPWNERQSYLYKTFFEQVFHNAHFESFPFEHTPPPENKILSFSYAYSDTDNDTTMRPAAAWQRLQDLNKHYNAEIFEGLVAKRTDAPYPHTTSPTHETPNWIKHRWAY